MDNKTPGQIYELGLMDYSMKNPYPTGGSLETINAYYFKQRDFALEAVATAVRAPLVEEVEKWKADTFHKINVPGVWKCHTCNFVQHRNVICPKGIYADIETMMEPCPNEGDVMFPMTWEEMAKENQEFGIKLMDREKAKDEEITRLRSQLEVARKALEDAATLLWKAKPYVTTRTPAESDICDSVANIRHEIVELVPKLKALSLIPKESA